MAKSSFLGLGRPPGAGKVFLAYPIHVEAPSSFAEFSSFAAFCLPKNIFPLVTSISPHKRAVCQYFPNADAQPPQENRLVLPMLKYLQNAPARQPHGEVFMKDVEGKTAFITGGANGTGLGMAKVFLKNGMKVVIADIRQDSIDRAGAHFGSERNIHAVRLDVTDREAFMGQ